jgi:hypothetical protein
VSQTWIVPPIYDQDADIWVRMTTFSSDQWFEEGVAEIRPSGLQFYRPVGTRLVGERASQALGGGHHLRREIMSGHDA